MATISRQSRHLAVLDRVRGSASRSLGVPRSIAISSGSVGLPSRRSSPTFLPSSRSRRPRSRARRRPPGRRCRAPGRRRRTPPRSPASALGEHRAEAGAGLEQLGGLEADHAQVVVDREVGVVHVHQLQHLALGDHVGRVGQHLQHAHAVRPTPSSGRRASRGSRRPARWPALPNSALAVGRPRRSADSSTTSSCSRVAVWMNSTIAASSKRSRPRSRARRRTAAPARPDALAAGADDVVRDLVDQRDARTPGGAGSRASTSRMSSAISATAAAGGGGG